MKKSFTFASKNKTPERNIDSIKYEIKKYLARERRKELPEGTDFWAFDCKIGADDSVSEVLDVKDIGKNIDSIFKQGHGAFYLEIIARAAYKSKTKETQKK